MYAVQEVGLRAVRPGLFTWCSSAVKRLEAAREAETGRVLFASMSVVMNGHVFVENGLRGAVQWGNKDAGHLADSQTVKNCAIQKHDQNANNITSQTVLFAALRLYIS